jgi:hypothetical protein
LLGEPGVEARRGPALRVFNKAVLSLSSRSYLSAMGWNLRDT